jgi:2'-5' RNA ligase
VSDERARLFVALELPDAARAELIRWRSDALGELGGVRLLAPDAMHATLCFLGWRARTDIAQIGAACEVVAREPAVSVSLGGAVWLPKRRPRVVAVSLGDPDGALARVQSAVSGALQAGSWYTPEARPYMGHVTVARFGRGAIARASELPPPAPLRFQASLVTLFRSRLSPAGAQYEPQVTITLV